jgi:hypothetical protein
MGITGPVFLDQGGGFGPFFFDHAFDAAHPPTVRINGGGIGTVWVQWNDAGYVFDQAGVIISFGGGYVPHIGDTITITDPDIGDGSGCTPYSIAIVAALHIIPETTAISPATPPPAVLDDAVIGDVYSFLLNAIGGDSPPVYAFSLIAGTLPAGLSLNASTGEISGTPTTPGTSSFTINLTDSAVTYSPCSGPSNPQSVSQQYTIRSKSIHLISVSPDHGPHNGGNTVALVGEHFVDGMTVAFDGVDSDDVTFIDTEHVTALVPEHAVDFVDVKITNPDTEFDTLVAGYDYRTFTITPDSGRLYGGDDVTIEAYDLVDGVSIRFGTVEDNTWATDVVIVDDTHLTCKTPEHIVGPVDVELFWPDGWTETAASLFTYKPFITPNVGNPAGGEPFIIGWSDLISGTIVTFGGAPATGVTALTINPFTNEPDALHQYLKGLTPPHPSAVVDVSILGSDAPRVLPAGYSFRIVVIPATGRAAGGDAFTIIGAGFVPGMTVTFDGVPATSVDIVDSTHITGITPAHARGVVAVLVSGGGIPAGEYTFEQSTSPPILHMGPNLIAKGPLPSTVRTLVTLTRGTDVSSLTYHWTQISGPDAPTIATPTTLNTNITFSTFTPGIYTFQLVVATTGPFALSSTGQLTVTIEAPRGPNVTTQPVTLTV